MSLIDLSGFVRKMAAAPGGDDVVQYRIRMVSPSQEVETSETVLSTCLEQKIRLEWLEKMHCVGCGRDIAKSFGGYCYPCTRSKAACDICVLDPVRCHYDEGTCREPDWGDTHCNIPHIVYLAAGSALKIGITRASQVPTRWIDQGAQAAISVFAVNRRKTAGWIENELRKQFTDKTDWRKLVRGIEGEFDLALEREKVSNDLSHLREVLAKDAHSPARSVEGVGAELVPLFDDAVQLRYPVLQYPEKAVSLNLEKLKVVEGVLLGIRGQYLLLDSGVINLRKYEGYLCHISTTP